MKHAENTSGLPEENQGPAINGGGADGCRSGRQLRLLIVDP